MKRRTIGIWATGAGVFLALLSVSCGKDKLGLGPGNGLFVTVSGNLINSALGQETIVRAELLLDGDVINTVNCSPPCGAATMVGFKTDVKAGRHTVAFRIANQSSSPNTYETVGASVETLTSRFELGGAVRSLATGESISFEVDLSR